LTAAQAGALAADAAAVPAAGADGAPGRVGPNAIIRTAEALDALLGPAAAATVFGRAGLAPYLARPPEAMVAEDEIARLNAALWRSLPAGAAEAVAREAGRRTGVYLLAARIPAPAQAMLRLLPGPVALRLLMRAVARHAWTFAGSGSFDWRPVPGGVAVTIAGSPLAVGLRGATTVCGLYAATFETLARALADRDARCAETACGAAGDPACRFAIRLR